MANYMSRAMIKEMPIKTFLPPVAIKVYEYDHIENSVTATKQQNKKRYLLIAILFFN